MSTTPNNTRGLADFEVSTPKKVTEGMNNTSNISLPLFDNSAMDITEIDERESPSISLPKPVEPSFDSEEQELDPSSPKARSDREQPARANDESDEDRARREEEESIALAQQLMAEEAMAVSYHMSVDYLRNNRDQFSEEDLAALQAAIAADEEEEQQEDEEIIEATTSGEGMSYELMLRLGERLGDVKTERWARVAHEKIASLPTLKFDPKTAEGKDDNDCDVKCLVCQFPYEKDDILRRLPCTHCFHAECVDQWLKTKDHCPYCRTTIVEDES